MTRYRETKEEQDRQAEIDNGRQLHIPAPDFYYEDRIKKEEVKTKIEFYM